MTSISELINAELTHIETVLNTRGSVQSRLDNANKNAPHITPPELPPEAQSLPREFLSAPASAATYRKIWDGIMGQPHYRYEVAPGHEVEARRYVQELLGVDLSKVRVEIVPIKEWDEEDNAEATTLKGGMDSHLILFPEICEGYPPEVMVHELGHTAHFTAQRSTHEYPYFWVAPLTTEFVAHFCQYNYILEHRPRADFWRALGQFVGSTYALAIFASGVLQDFQRFIETKEAQAFRQSWPMNELANNFELFRQNQSYFRTECLRGIAQILALSLIDEREGMRRFIHLDRIDRSVMSKLNAAFPGTDVLKAFTEINEQLALLLQRFVS